ncbi:MAG TPA: Hsp20/alpha crystallin family protein [Gaiellaceae bacterium]|jgi:HSP20 family protein|nr:Hsp20/alpha crystallin family protein [Gaiellaceae bacterium]
MGRRKVLKDELDELFADLWQVSRLGGLRRGFRPQVDSFRSENPATFTVIVDIAGIDPDQVRVTAGDGALIIAGERRREACEGRVYQQIEIEYGQFERLVQLPVDVDLAKAEARYDRGLLTIQIPIAARAPAPQPVPIEIRRQQG